MIDGLEEVAEIQHRVNDYPRIVRLVDVSKFPHGTKLYIIKDQSMAVRAKFKVAEIQDGTVKMHPVTSGSKENDSFFKATPSGQLTMGIVNPDALKQFAVGDEYYVDFNKAS